MRTSSKLHHLRTVRRRAAVRCANALNGWALIAEDVNEVHDPQAIELAVVVGLCMGQLQDRLADLDDDAAEVSAGGTR